MSPDSYTANRLMEHVLRFVFDFNALQEAARKEASSLQLGEFVFCIFTFLLCTRTERVHIVRRRGRNAVRILRHGTQADFTG